MVRSFVRGTGRLPCPLKCPTDVFNIIRRCWSVDRKERPSFKELHKFFLELLGEHDSFELRPPPITQPPDLLSSRARGFKKSSRRHMHRRNGRNRTPLTTIPEEVEGSSADSGSNSDALSYQPDSGDSGISVSSGSELERQDQSEDIFAALERDLADEADREFGVDRYGYVTVKNDRYYEQDLLRIMSGEAMESEL